MGEEVAELLLGVDHARANAGRVIDADVADLAAGFAVERRLVEDDDARLARRASDADLVAVAHERGTTPSALSVS